MKIKNHRLFTDDDKQVRFEASPNQSTGLDPRYLILHYTAGASLESSVNWLKNPQAKASAHVVIGRDGKVVQMVPFNRVAWHAGKSSWAGLQGLNQFSIGIELDNWGILKRSGDRWISWLNKAVDAKDVIEATHKNGSPSGGWQTYTAVQLEKAIEVGLALNAKYHFVDVLGHEDISPGRKSDPGPAFPVGAVRSRIMGRSEDAEHREETTVHLNIRQGPGTEHAILDGSPLPPGTPVAVVGESGLWRQVDVLVAIGGNHDIHGWVHGRFLRPVVQG